jgi:hypothetical protein
MIYKVIYKTDTGEMTSNYFHEVQATSYENAFKVFWSEAASLPKKPNMIINVIRIK